MIIFSGSLFLVSAFASLASGEDKNVAVDQAIGGMEQGRRIQSPGNYNNKGIASGQPGSATTPAHDIHTVSQESEKGTVNSQGKNIADGGNHGFLYVNGQASNSQNGTNQAGREQTNANANTGQASTGQENSSTNAGSAPAGTEQPNGSTNVNAGETSTGQTGSTNVNVGESPTGQTSGSVNVNTGETSTGQTSGSAEVNTPQAGTEQIGGSTNVGTPVQQAGQTTTEQVNNPVDTSAGTNGGTGETNTGSNGSGTPTESSGASSNPIVGVDANVNPESGAVQGGVQTDTSGQLEDRQIIDAGATTGQTSTQTQTGSATQITGQETVHQTDVTTQPVTQTTEQTGTTIPTATETNTGTGNGGILPGGSSGTTTQESSSGTSSNPIVGVDANVNPESGAVEGGVQTDTSGQLEDRQIIDAGATTGQTSTQTETGSATEITGQEVIHQADVTTEPVTQTTGQTGETTTSLETQGNGGVLVGGETSPTGTGQIGTGEINTGTGSSGTSTQESSSGTSSNPIVGVDANVNPESGAVDAGVHTDTSGQLEDRQIIDAGATSGQTSTQTQTGSATEITGQETVHQADITTQPVTDATGQTGTTTPITTETNTGTGNGGILPGGSSGAATQESSGTSNNPIVGVEANVNPNSGAVDAGVHTDTSGQLEDRQIIDAGATGEGTGSTGAQVGSASGITGSETVHGTDITTQPVTEATGQTGTGEISTGTGNGGVLVGGETSPTGQVETGATNIGSSGSGTSTESPGTSNNPIVGVDANVNPESGAVEGGVQTDTSGQLEDRQIIDAGVTGETTGSTGAQVGSASDITGQEVVHQADVTTQPVTDATGQTGETTTSVETEGNGGFLVGGETSPTGQVETGAINTGSSGSGTSTEESSGTSSNPIVGVEAGIDQNSGTPNAEVTVDTSDELEEREILDADLTGETTGSTGAEVGSATDITDADLVEESDITTEVVDGPTSDQISGSTTGETSSGSQTSSESPDASSNPIIDLETNINPESGTADANVDIDTRGEIEDREILAIDLAAEGVSSSGTQTDSASGITGSETVHDANVTTPVTTTGQTSTITEAQTGTSTVLSETQTSGAVESLIPAPSDFGTEIDTTGQTSGGVADVGIAAEIDGVGEGAEEASDPADGLSTSVPGL